MTESHSLAIFWNRLAACIGAFPNPVTIIIGLFTSEVSLHKSWHSPQTFVFFISLEEMVLIIILKYSQSSVTSEWLFESTSKIKNLHQVASFLGAHSQPVNVMERKVSELVFLVYKELRR